MRSAIAAADHYLELFAWANHERWDFPVLAPAARNNFAASFQLTYRPNWESPPD